MPRLFSLLACMLLLAGCAGTRTARTPARPATALTPAPIVRASQRPLPEEVKPPRDFQEAVAAGTRTTTGAPGPRYWQQEADYTFTARLLPDAKRLEGTGRIRYKNNSPDPLDALHLELAQNFHAPGAARSAAGSVTGSAAYEVTGGVDLQRVAVRGQVLEAAGDKDAGARYEVLGTQLVLRPATPVRPGETVEIEVAWAFGIPQAGAGARMGHSDGNLFFLAYWYPILSVYDDVEGWHTDAFLGQSEFYNDFADYDVTIEAPPGWLVMATGALANPDEVLKPAVARRMRQAHRSDTTMVVVGPDGFGASTQEGEGGWLRWRFSADTVRDFAFTATRESIWTAARTPVGDHDGDGTPDFAHINTFYREAAPRWKEVTRYQQHSIAFLSTYTGFPYPWPHMTAVEGADIITGGMEFPMMTLIGDYNARGDSALYNVTVHELAHMWVPLTVGIDERRYSWIDEGTTSFHENEARFDFFPGPDHHLPDQETYLNLARAEGEGELMRWSGFHTTGAAFGVASYQKPATVLVALREVIGEEAFRAGLRSFIADWAYKHPYPWDFFNAFERAAGQDLDWFWHSWYFETWTLDQALAEVNVQGDEAEIVVADVGKVPMPVLLEVTHANGETTHLRVPVETWLGGARRATVTVQSPSPVTRIVIDPAHRLPDIDRSNNVWTR